MFCRSHPSTVRAGARTAASAMLLALLATGAQAQYKVVAPDGSVTYTDRPPQQAVAAGSKVMANSAPPSARKFFRSPKFRRCSVRLPPRRSAMKRAVGAVRITSRCRAVWSEWA